MSSCLIFVSTQFIYLEGISQRIQLITDCSPNGYIKTFVHKVTGWNGSLERRRRKSLDDTQKSPVLQGSWNIKFYWCMITISSTTFRGMQGLCQGIQDLQEHTGSPSSLIKGTLRGPKTLIWLHNHHKCINRNGRFQESWNAGDFCVSARNQSHDRFLFFTQWAVDRKFPSWSYKLQRVQDTCNIINLIWPCGHIHSMMSPTLMPLCISAAAGCGISHVGYWGGNTAKFNILTINAWI